MAGSTQQVHPKMTPSEMKSFYLEQTLSSLEQWEQNNFKIQGQPPFGLDRSEASSLLITPELAKKLNIRKQITEFAEEAKVSTAGVRENQDVLCSWDHRYRINEYIFALLAEALARLAQELQAERVAALPTLDVAQIRAKLGEENAGLIEEIFGIPLAEAIDFARANPLRMVGGEVRSNTPRYCGSAEAASTPLKACTSS